MCKISPIFKQFLTIFSCNLLAFSFGQQSGWATINFIELQSENEQFSVDPLTLAEASLVVSIINVGGFISNLVALPIIRSIGVKRTIHIFGAAFIIGPLLIICAQNVCFLYIARILCGFSGGVLSVSVPSLVSDISHDKLHGTLNSLTDPLCNIGIIVSFCLGNYLNWVNQAKVQLIAPTIAIIILFFLPESPEYWTNRNEEKRAIEAHKFYKGSIAALEHAEFLHKLKAENAEKGIQENRPIDNGVKSNSKLCVRDFFTPHAKRAFFIAFTGLALSYCSGTVMILSYVTEIFTKTGSSLSPKDSSILISMTQMAANLTFLNIVDRINRKTLLICSSMITIITLFLYAIYCLLWMNQPEIQWIPTVCFALIVFSSMMGQVPIPFIVMTEIFPKKIRQTSVALAISMYWAILFLLGSIFPLFLETFGPFICLGTFGVISVVHLIFSIIFLPETRGKSNAEIMTILNK